MAWRWEAKPDGSPNAVWILRLYTTGKGVLDLHFQEERTISPLVVSLEGRAITCLRSSPFWQQPPDFLSGDLPSSLDVYAIWGVGD